MAVGTAIGAGNELAGTVSGRRQLAGTQRDRWAARAWGLGARRAGTGWGTDYV